LVGLFLFELLILLGGELGDSYVDFVLFMSYFFLSFIFCLAGIFFPVFFFTLIITVSAFCFCFYVVFVIYDHVYLHWVMYVLELNNS